MNNIGGKSGIKAIERVVSRNIIAGNGVKVVDTEAGQEVHVEFPTPPVVPEHVKPEQHKELHDKVEQLKSLHETTSKQVSTFMNTVKVRVGAVEEDIKKTSQKAFYDLGDLEALMNATASALKKEVEDLKAKPAQVIEKTTVVKPGVTVHENVLIPITSKWVWVILAVLTIAQAAQLWRLLM